MGIKLIVEIGDKDLPEGEAWVHELNSETPWSLIVESVQVLYPEALSLYLYGKEVEDPEED